VFSVTATDGGRSVFHWGELLDLPLGAAGRLGWPAVRPAFVGGVRLSLRRFARFCSTYEDTEDTEDTPGTGS
jgi:hypothetical protein